MGIFSLFGILKSGNLCLELKMECLESYFEFGKMGIRTDGEIFERRQRNMF